MPNYTFGTNGTVTTPDGRVIPYPAAPPADYRFGTPPLTPVQQAGPPGSNPLSIAGNSASLFPNTVPPDMPLWPMSSFPVPTQPQWPWNNPQGMNPPPNPNPAPPPAANNPPPALPQPAAQPPATTPQPSPIQAWFQQFAQNAMPNNPPPAGVGDPALLAQLPPQPPAPPRPAGPAVFSQGAWHPIPPGVDPWVAQFDADQNRLPGVPAANNSMPNNTAPSPTAPGFFGGIQQAASNVTNPISTTIGQAMDSSGPRMRQFGGTRSLNRQLTNHLASR